jgi:hypothetical protein
MPLDKNTYSSLSFVDSLNPVSLRLQFIYSFCPVPAAAGLILDKLTYFKYNEAGNMF